jgi:hypothetical protein
MNTRFFLVAAVVATTLGASLTASTGAMAQGRDRREESRTAPGPAPRAVTQRPQTYPPIGREVRTLPEGHREIRVNRNNYRYYSGVFYRLARPDVYAVVSAPLGARVRSLPGGYVSFLIGPRRYFYVNYTYYLWDEPRREYIVVEEPEGAAAALVSASESGAGQLFVYPSEGQSEERRDRDRYECYQWAAEQTGYDPAAENPQAELASDYRRAQSACLEGRGYTVR